MNILFIGAINLNQKPRGGEEFKNQLLLPILKGSLSTDIIDTTNWKKKPIVLFNIFFSLVFLKHEKILVSTSTISAYRLFKFIRYCCPFKLKRIKYFVIGGYLPKGISDGKLNPEIYKKLGGIVVEGQLLMNKLFKYNIPSTVIPNFKNNLVRRISQDQVKVRIKTTIPYRFVFLSRMIEEKGIYKILQAVKQLNDKIGDDNVIVDFYGPIDNYNFTKFDTLKPANCFYRGYLNLSDESNDNYKILETYHALLFPSSWYGEGFPGIFIDAFLCGLPVLCSNNNMNNEIILDSYNGLVYDIEDIDNGILDSMLRLIADKTLLYDLSINSYQSFQKYSVSNCKDLILTELLK